MLFAFPFVFVRLSLDLLFLTTLVMGMTNEENFDGSSSRPAVRLVEMIMLIEMIVFGKANVHVLYMRSMSRLFYKLSFELFLFP